MKPRSRPILSKACLSFASSSLAYSSTQSRFSVAAFRSKKMIPFGDPKPMERRVCWSTLLVFSTAATAGAKPRTPHLSMISITSASNGTAGRSASGAAALKKNSRAQWTCATSASLENGAPQVRRAMVVSLATLRA